jgi:hypothetical protein
MEEALTGSDADSPVMKSLKDDLLVSCRKRMSVFVEIQVDDAGDVTFCQMPSRRGFSTRGIRARCKDAYL